jgi:hypothetical protein
VGVQNCTTRRCVLVIKVLVIKVLVIFFIVVAGEKATVCDRLSTAMSSSLSTTAASLDACFV